MRTLETCMGIDARCIRQPMIYKQFNRHTNYHITLMAIIQKRQLYDLL